MNDIGAVEGSTHVFLCGRPRVIAFDFDGTLTDGGRPAPETIGALAQIRKRGIRIVLVTGRILSELEAVFADVTEHFDAMVLENGAVVAVGARISPAAPPIDRALFEALASAGIGARRGTVIVATSGSAEHDVVDAVVRLGLECQLVHNRGELMVLPSGVNKGTGLITALGELGLSLHDCIAVGDAENDHSLLGAAEFGVAVANAIKSLKAEADLVLGSPDGAGAIELLGDVAGANHFWGSRSRPTMTVGDDDDGEPVLLRARPTNMIIAGGTGDGKSYLAGLLAEQLISMEYSVLVVDPEGDHVGLELLRPAVVVGAERSPPTVGTVASLLKRSDACVIVDLSSLDEAERLEYLADVPAEVEACRRGTGRPHWVFFDEAHRSIGQHEAALGTFEPAARGYCLITWRPSDLPSSMIASTDTVLALTSPTPDDALVDLVAAVAARPKEAIAALLSRPAGQVLIARRGTTEPPRIARLGGRLTSHFRHEHKYDVEGTDAHRALWFRDDYGHATGVIARNLQQLEHELTRCPRAVLRHHGPSGDISRWIDDVFHDQQLAATVRTIERRIQMTSPGAVVDGARLDLIGALRARHRE